MRFVYWIKDNPFASHLFVAIICGGTSGILFATGFGAIALSIFISILVCALLMLAKEYMSLKDDLIGFAELTKNTFASMSKDFSEEMQAQREGHHEDIQGIYIAMSNVLGEDEE